MQLPVTPSLRVDGKRALVTGASRGIGLGAAVALAEAGAHVVLVARSATDLNEVVQAITRQGGSAEALVLDLTDLSAVQASLSTQPAFDILVNNAGANRPGAMTDLSIDDFDYVMDINVRVAWYVAKIVTAGMIQAGKGGSVIHTSSQMGLVGGVDRTVYSASKHAIEGMSKSMAIELAADNIRVNTLCPTFIRTPLAEKTLADPERLDWVLSKIKLGRVGEIEDIMGAVVFLASPAAALITGTSLVVDGGWTAD